MACRERPPIFGPYLLQPNGRMDQDATWYGGRPQPRRLCVRWGPRSTLPKNGGSAPSPIFGRFLFRSNGCNTAVCIKMPLGMEVDLSPGDFVLDGNPDPLNFRPMYIIVIVISLEHCTKHSRYWFIQVQVLYSMHSILAKFNRTHAVCSN